MTTNLTDDHRHILTIIATHSDPWLTTVEIADQTDYVRRTVHKKLTALAEDGYVNTKQVGSNGRGWWLSPIGRAVINERADSIDAAGDTVDEPDSSTQPSETGDDNIESDQQSDRDTSTTVSETDTAETQSELGSWSSTH